MKINTKILFGDDGKEFDSGRTTKRSMTLEVLTLEDALERFDEGKRVYFIYQNNKRFHCNCRKICSDRDYLIDHYQCYHEVCGKQKRK